LQYNRTNIVQKDINIEMQSASIKKYNKQTIFVVVVIVIVKVANIV